MQTNKRAYTILFFSNAIVTNYFIIFLQIADVTNFY